MSKKRMSSAERHGLILQAARTVFSGTGCDGAKTQRIAAEAKRFEALVYRHIPSKLALCRAVLRQPDREQGANDRTMFLPEPGRAGVIVTNRRHLGEHTGQGQSPSPVATAAGQ